MRDMTLAQQYATFATSLEFGALSDDVVEMAKTCLKDSIAHALASLQRPEAVAARATFLEVHDRGTACVWGTDIRTSSATAAYLNALTCSCTIQNDTLVVSNSHPGMSVIPTIFALSEESDCSGRDLIVALVAGYEIIAHFGKILVSPDFAKCFRATSHVGPIGAAAAASRILKLTPSQTTCAISLNANTMSGFNAWAAEGTNDLVFHSAPMARNAIEAAKLVAHDLKMAEQIFESPSGVFSAFRVHFDAKNVIDELSELKGMSEVIFKPAPTCVFTQGACLLSDELAQKYGAISPEEIVCGEVRVTNAAQRYPGCDNPSRFMTQFDAQLSIQFSTIAILAAGGLRYAPWDNWSDPTLQAAASRIELVSDDKLSDKYPETNGSIVKIQLSDGRLLEAELPNFASMTAEAIQDRFMLNASQILGSDNASRLSDLIANLDRPEATIRDLAASLAPSSHARAS
ncbi:MmgE/PrpD family protein [Martelella soudanensis]|uniref:MmgE/PrpD family protein n=1 Tax=unclassified Martelella TaxID=2629616 RepID=UPI0015DE44B0|nr:MULTISPECIES: MmgE/PrpD family protein [unclassified Martelella]